MYDNIVAFVARGTDSGKTYVLEQVLTELKQRGLRVTAVKHGAHVQILDTEGKDSSKFARTGADRIIVFSDHGYLIYETNPPEIDLLAQIAAHNVDIVLVEGFKRGPFKKIEVFNHTRYESPLCGDGHDNDYLAIITDQEIELSLPRFRFDDIRGICDFLQRHIAQSPA